MQRVLLFTHISSWGGEVGKMRKHKYLPLFQCKNVKRYKNIFLILVEAIFPHRTLISQPFLKYSRLRCQTFQLTLLMTLKALAFMHNIH